ncbi:MAG: TetR/AcrR family transcriptional regulator [Verrucomicrobiota bacterium JB023]|nr:TetR/AcrR family transcriptional regulator [Verrucomicrobiota bacterium JB023]
MSESEMKNETRERLLDAAEGLFAEKGFEAVSLRDITRTAGANVASVNYHFGSKEGLINEVMKRHALPVNEERVRRLEGLLEGEARPEVREVIEAFLDPLIERITEADERRRLFGRFMGRVTGEEAKGIPSEMVPAFTKMMKLTVAAFQRALPGLSTEETLCRIKFCFAVMTQALLRDEVFEQITERKLAAWEPEKIYQEVLVFCTGGMAEQEGKA